MTTLEEPLLEAPVFRESTLVPSVLKRRYARLYACAASIACLCLAAALPGRLGNPHLASYVEGANLVVQRVPTATWSTADRCTTCRDKVGTSRAPGATHLSQVWHLTKAHQVGRLRQRRYSVLKPGCNHSLLALVSGAYEERQLVRCSLETRACCAALPSQGRFNAIATASLWPKHGKPQCASCRPPAPARSL